jgi:hypothetical protein
MNLHLVMFGVGLIVFGGIFILMLIHETTEYPSAAWFQTQRKIGFLDFLLGAFIPFYLLLATHDFLSIYLIGAAIYFFMKFTTEIFGTWLRVELKRSASRTELVVFLIVCFIQRGVLWPIWSLYGLKRWVKPHVESPAF